MPDLRQRLKQFATGAVLASAMGLGGCADGVELNGKVFDWMGVSPSALAAAKREPQLADRAPLVLPPDPNRLPEPGSGQTPTDLAWPADPEQRKIAQAKERERLHLAYCRGEIQWKERALNKDSSAPLSPYGPCPGIFGGLTSGVNKN
jgi:hypothetical protein